MRQKLILHIGTHKTGSTTIQNYLYYNRLWLRYLGVYYPRPINGSLFYTNNHSDLRDTARAEGQKRKPHTHRKFGPHDDLLNTYIAQIKAAKAPLTILSCEGWSAQMNLFAERLAELKLHFDVGIIAFMRRPDYWIESLYRQRVVNIEHQESRSFDEFRALKTMELAIHDRGKIFDWWAQVFGADNIAVIPYEPATEGFDLLDKFFETAGVRKGVTRHLLMRNARANPSLNAAQIEIIRLLHKYGYPVDQALIKRLKQTLPGVPSGYLSPAERALLLARAAPDMQVICDRFVRDGRSELFPNDPEAKQEREVWNRRQSPEIMATFEALIREKG